jgi:structural maintenance of chromosomes protein 6
MTRRQVFERFRKDITIRAKTFFTHLLEQRGYHGKLIIDHRNHEIRVKVTPPGRVQSSTNKDAKQLSGGEKSFAQICLLLSVWEAMGSPIRALDEL